MDLVDPVLDLVAGFFKLARVRMEVLELDLGLGDVGLGSGDALDLVENILDLDLDDDDFPDGFNDFPFVAVAVVAGFPGLSLEPPEPLDLVLDLPKPLEPLGFIDALAFTLPCLPFPFPFDLDFLS